MVFHENRHSVATLLVQWPVLDPMLSSLVSLGML
jgi:hypothetical protein